MLTGVRPGLGAIFLGAILIVMGVLGRRNFPKVTKVPWNANIGRDRPFTLDEWKQYQISFSKGARVVGAIFVGFGIVLLIINFVHPIRPS